MKKQTLLTKFNIKYILNNILSYTLFLQYKDLRDI